MNAISLWQPWASAMAIGVKRFETRSWGTGYRGPLCIAAARRPVDALGAGLWHEAVRTAEPSLALAPWELLPLGAVVAVGRLVEVYRIDAAVRARLLPRPTPGTAMSLEELLGDWSDGRFAWRFEDLRAVVPAVPVRGRQGIFVLPGQVAVDVSRAVQR